MKVIAILLSAGPALVSVAHLKWFPRINVGGDLFAAMVCFGLSAVVKLVSSLFITRLINPDAYGIVAILMSIIFLIEMLADLGVNVFVIRDVRAEEPSFLNTAWTIRFVRSVVNCCVLLSLSSFIANTIYGTPALTAPLRVCALWFVISGLETMAFTLAVRRKKARIPIYVDLGVGILGTIFTISYCYVTRDYWAIIYGTTFCRVLQTALSYFFYRDYWPRMEFNKEAAKAIFSLTKYSLPSSMLTLALSQFDKIVFLRLFNLHLLGIVGVAGGIAGPIESLINRISQSVLYPRCAHNYREEPTTFAERYYGENAKIFFGIMVIPAVVLGSASVLISILYPANYGEVGSVLRAVMVRTVLLSLALPSQEMLVAAGESQVILVGNTWRAGWLFTASFVGYWLFGFYGFIYGAALSGLPPYLYYLNVQARREILSVRGECLKVAFIVVAGVTAAVGAEAFRGFLAYLFGLREQMRGVMGH